MMNEGSRKIVGQKPLLIYKSPAGPLAHRVEQGTFNPKVPGSSPGRPTSSEHMYDARPLFDKLSPNTGPNNCWDR